MKKRSPKQLKNLLEGRLRRKLGEGAVRSLTDASSVIKEWYTTGIPCLDVIISGQVGKGLPSGRICELFGPEQSGKTTLGATIIRNAQQTGGYGVVIDTESTFTQDRAKQLGVNADAFTYVEEEFIEPILEAILTIVGSVQEDRVVVFWDTIAGTPSLQERGRNVGESPLGSHARSLSQGLRKLSRPLAKSNVLVLACNQRKEGAIGQMYATESEKDATLGGKAIRFHSEIRVRVSGSKTRYDSDRKEIGFEALAKVVKNKSFVRGGWCRLVFSYESNGQFDSALSCLRTLQGWKAIKQKGAMTVFNGKTMTDKSWKRKYDKDEDFRKQVHTLLEQAYAERFLPKEEEE